MPKGGDAYDAVGTLTIRGVTRDVTLPFRLSTTGDEARATGHLDLVRNDFGVGQAPWTSASGSPWRSASTSTSRRGRSGAEPPASHRDPAATVGPKISSKRARSTESTSAG